MKSITEDICGANALGSRKGEDDSIQHFSRALDMVAVVFNLSLKGLALLCRDITGRRFKDEVISSFMDFFITVLSQLRTCCLQEAQLKLSSINHENTHDGQNSMTGQGEMAAPFARGILGLLFNVVASPEFNKTHPSHIELLEGILSILLDQVGALLSHAVFGEYLCSSSAPGAISSANEYTIDSVEEYAVELRGRYLTSVLKVAMAGESGSHRLSLLGILPGAAVPGTIAGKEVLLTRAKRRLQATLMKGLFGDDCEKFLDVLRKPALEKPPDHDAAPLPTNPSNSFVESVWSLIGWDMILGSE